MAADRLYRLPDAVSKHDQQLIDECLAGRTDAFGELVVRHQDRLHNTLLKVLGSHEEARDVAQDTFVQAFQKLETFRGTAAFYSWLFRIAMNTAVSRMRKNRRTPLSVEAVRDRSGAEPVDNSREASPSFSAEIAEQRAQVHAALAELSDEFRTVLVLKEIEGLKYEEIAEALDCPIGTVRSRIFRARGELRQKLRHLLEDR